MNVLCSAKACPVLLSSTCVFYEGENLIYTGINTNDNLQEALQKIDETIGNTFSTFVPITRTLTINGVTYNLSANRTWNVGTVTSVDMSVPTGLTISGNPITGSGTLALGLASGYSIPTTANQATWTTAYNDSIISAAVTGTNTKTLTLNQQDGGTVTASWSDIDTGLTSVGVSMPAAFAVTNSPLTSNGTIGITGAGLASQYVRGDGALGDFPSTGGGGSSVSYYLNGSVNQGTFGGSTYYEMNRTPIIGGPGVNFSITNTSGLVSQFITDPLDPSLLLIPGGNWNVEFYFNASDNLDDPYFYVELYVYNGTTFTLIASNSTSPEYITNGTSIDVYYTSLAVPETIITVTDRLALRVYGNTDGNRTITLHTEDNTVSQIITTFSNGLTALNGLTKQVQYLATSTTGTDFTISSSIDTHTFNLPTASASNRGALSSADWITFNSKVGGTGVSGQVAYWNGTNSQTGSNNFTWDNAVGKLNLNSTTQYVSIAANTGLSIANSSTSANGVIGLTGSGFILQGRDGASTAYPILLQPYGGNVGIGTNAPSTTLDIRGKARLQASGNCEFDFNDGSQFLRVGVNSTSGFLQTLTSIPLGFFTGATKRGEFSTNGNFILQNGGAFTDGGQRLQVQGTTLLNGDVTFSSATGMFWDAANSRLGIAKTPANPYKLDVNGAIQTNSYIMTPAVYSLTFLQFGISGGTSAMNITTNRNVQIYDSTIPGDGGQRLQVYGDAFIKGSGNTSATTALTVQNSDGTVYLQLVNDGRLQLGTASNNVQIFPFNTSQAPSLTSRNLMFYSPNGSQVASEGRFKFDGNGLTQTSGTVINVKSSSLFAPTSGTAIHQELNLSPQINQTGGANGITRGLYVNPTLTAAADWRSIEWSNNSGWGLYGAGTADNYLGGNLRVGDTTDYNVRMSVVGAGAVPSTGTGASNIVMLLRDTTAGGINVGAGIAFAGNDGVNTGVTFASINGRKENSTSGNYATYLSFATRANGDILTERVRITSTGNLGLGTTSPTSYAGYTTLAINNASVGSVIDFMQGGIVKGQILGSASTLEIGTVTTIPIVFYTNNVERARITSGGNLLVGTTTDAGYKFDVNGNVRIASSYTASGTVAIETWQRIGGAVSADMTYNDANTSMNFGTSTSHSLNIKTNNTTALSINSSGAATFSSSVTATSFIPSGSGIPTNGMYLPSANTLGFATNSAIRATLDSSGNLGLGVQPSAWSGLSGKVFEFGTAFGDKGSIFQNDVDDLRLMSNVYFDGSFRYVRTGTATIFHSNNGSYKWNIAPSGTAGNAITFTQAMTLTSGGNLLVGTTADQGYRVQITGSGDNMLNVWGATAPSIRLDNAASGASQRFVIGLATGTNQFIQGAVAGNVCLSTQSVSPWLFGMWNGTNASEVMRITTSNNLLIGTNTDSGERLQVSGSAKVSGKLIVNHSSTDYIAEFLNTSSANPYGVIIKDAASAANNYPLFHIVNNAASVEYFRVNSGTGTAVFSSSVTAASFIKSGGTSSQYLMADGSVTTGSGGSVDELQVALISQVFG